MILTEKELAEYLKVTSIFLYKCRRKGLPYLRLSHNCIRYNLNVVLKWFEENNMLLTNEKNAGEI